ncbi:MAG TPA: hypothetical protein PLG25_06580 [bacterium]|nr:hypothetical protein [bacterium]HMZ03344.1 hypothetical protein [bacterium]HNB08657.1 hypothetical protein [bacterium]HNB55329.1 hypothetical protein [bacterium]HND77414.1 hypothetical protein [bacterium]
MKTKEKMEVIDSPLFQTIEREQMKSVQGGKPPGWTMAEQTVYSNGTSSEDSAAGND